MEIEKSLELLVTAVTALSQNMDMRFDKMEERMERMEGDIAGLKTDVAKLRISNEQHIVPALKAIGENWSDMYKSVKVTREKVEQLEETQSLQGLILEGRIVKAK